MNKHIILASILNSNDIPKAAPTFLGSSITTGLVQTHSDIGVIGKSKMGAITFKYYSGNGGHLRFTISSFCIEALQGDLWRNSGLWSHIKLKEIVYCSLKNVVFGKLIFFHMSQKNAWNQPVNNRIMYKKVNRVNSTSSAVLGEFFYGKVMWCHVNVGKIIEYNAYTCNTSRDTTIWKSKRVNLPSSAVLYVKCP